MKRVIRVLSSAASVIGFLLAATTFKHETTNTTTDTTNIDVKKETNVTNTIDSNNTDNSNSGNHSNNTVELKADVDVNSHNDTAALPPATYEETLDTI